MVQTQLKGRTVRCKIEKYGFRTGTRVRTTIPGNRTDQYRQKKPSRRANRCGVRRSPLPCYIVSETDYFLALLGKTVVALLVACRSCPPRDEIGLQRYNVVVWALQKHPRLCHYYFLSLAFLTRFVNNHDLHSRCLEARRAWAAADACENWTASPLSPSRPCPIIIAGRSGSEA